MACTLSALCRSNGLSTSSLQSRRFVRADDQSSYPRPRYAHFSPAAYSISRNLRALLISLRKMILPNFLQNMHRTRAAHRNKLLTGNPSAETARVPMQHRSKQDF